LLRIRRPDRWYLAGALLILLAVSLLSYQDWTAFQRSAPQVQHSRALLQQVEQVLSYTKDAETGQRGYVLTGDSQYLDSYNAAITALPSELQKLRQLVAEDAPLRTRVATLDGLISEKLAESKVTVALRQNEGLKAALSEEETNRGKQAMDEIREIGQDLQNEV
jgi:CHASE3 domain sensor protein